MSGSKVFGAGCELPSVWGSLGKWWVLPDTSKIKPPGKANRWQGSSTPTPMLVTYFKPLLMEVYVWWSAYRSLLFWHLGRVRGLLQERCCGHKSFFCSSLLTCHHALHFFFLSLRPSPWQRREKPYCSPHLCLSPLCPVVSLEATIQVQTSHCTPCMLQGLIPGLQQEYKCFWLQQKQCRDTFYICF